MCEDKYVILAIRFYVIWIRGEFKSDYQGFMFLFYWFISWLCYFGIKIKIISLQFITHTALIDMINQYQVSSMKFKIFSLM